MPKIVDADAVRNELLSKAAVLFARRGYGSLTIREIATEAGVSTGTLYHYFKGKEDLFRQLCAAACDWDIRTLGELRATHADPGEEPLIVLWFYAPPGSEARWVEPEKHETAGHAG